MQEAKNTQRALVRIGYDGRVYKQFKGPKAEERFANEIRVLQYLASRGCAFVPALLDHDENTLEIVTSNCGTRVEQLSEEKTKALFNELERYGVRHDDPFVRNVTYQAIDGQFCIIDFEFATILQPELEGQLLSTEPSQLLQPSRPPSRVAWSGCSHPGRFRPNNEDTFLVAQINRRGIQYLGKTGEGCPVDHEYLFAVSDGMGGEKSGEFASRIAIKQITQLLPRCTHFPAEEFALRSEEILNDLFQSIHREMTQLSQTDLHCRNMGATLTLAWVRNGHCYYAHVGDSRLYFLSDATMRQVTEDHTHVGWLRRNGKINEREARYHPRKNVLNQALGAGHQYLTPNIGGFRIQSGDSLVLCTDGVHEGLWDRGIQELIESPTSSQLDQPPAQRLVFSAIERSRDNASSIVATFQ